MPAATSPRAINWAEPANTKADIAIVPINDMPLLIARVPKIKPNGMAPTIKGNVSLAPAKKVDAAEDVITLWGFKSGRAMQSTGEVASE